MTKAVLPAMRRQRSGHVVMVSSIGGLAKGCCETQGSTP